MNGREESEVYLDHWKDIDLLLDITPFEPTKMDYCLVVHHASM